VPHGKCWLEGRFVPPTSRHAGCGPVPPGNHAWPQ